eukprot:Hpha_TRINITY_DN16667_c1_g1::TRINITY_DN16667_c1_g1_i3::g.178843::m.178843
MISATVFASTSTKIQTETKVVTMQSEGKLCYRYEPYAHTPTVEKTVMIPEAPSCPAPTGDLYWTTPYETTPYETTPYEYAPQYTTSAPVVDPIPQQAFPQAWYVPAQQQMQTPPLNPVSMEDSSLSLSISRESTAPMAAPSIFDGCRSRRERRALAVLVITKGLQQGKNRTYGAARRKMTKWAQLQGISKEDLQAMVEYLNELCLAGAAYDYVAAGVPASSLAEDVSERAISHVAHLLSVSEMWEGCLCYLTPAECYARSQ